MEILTGIAGPVLAFVLLVVPLIVVHELGHLIVARLRGIDVPEFGIDFHRASSRCSVVDVPNSPSTPFRSAASCAWRAAKRVIPTLQAGSEPH